MSTYILIKILVNRIHRILLLLYSNGARGGVVVKTLRYKPAGRGFDSRWCHNPSGRTTALGSTQPLTEIITRLFPGVKAAGA